MGASYQSLSSSGDEVGSSTRCVVGNASPVLGQEPIKAKKAVSAFRDKVGAVALANYCGLLERSISMGGSSRLLTLCSIQFRSVVRPACLPRILCQFH